MLSSKRLRYSSVVTSHTFHIYAIQKVCNDNRLSCHIFWVVTSLISWTEAVIIIQCLAKFFFVPTWVHYEKILNGVAFPKLNVHFKFILRFKIHGLEFKTVIKILKSKVGLGILVEDQYNLKPFQSIPELSTNSYQLVKVS